MQDKETRPFEQAQKTSQLNEGIVTPTETILNCIIDDYIFLKKNEGQEIPNPPTNKDINFVLAKYCDEHEGLSVDEKAGLRKTIKTLLEIRK